MTGLGLVALTLLSLATYFIASRLYFHPLSHVPGPPLAALTGYYVTYYDLVKDGHILKHLEQLHEKYGRVVRIGPNKLHFSSLEAYDSIYRDPRFPKEAWFYAAFTVPQSLFGCTDIKAAKERAAIVRPLFSRKKVFQLENVVQQVVNRFVSSLSKRSGAGDIINLYRGFSSVTMEVITTYCFAKAYHIVEYPNFEHPAMVGFQDSNFTVFIMQHFPFMRIVLFNMPPFIRNRFAPAAAGRVLFFQTLEDQITEILANPSSLENGEHETVYHHMLNPRNGVKFEKEALKQHGISLVAAGTETVANTCTMAAFHVLDNKEIGRKLRAELVDAWPELEVPLPLEKLEKLPYLTAVIQEALRLSHGVVSPLPRIVTEDALIGGVLVPKGTVVAMSQTFVHLNRDIFPNPKKFDPDRWLVKGAGDMSNYLVAFSKGQRSCIGVNLAWAELYLILGNLFRKAEGLKLFDTV
ncbi:cytochrome P450 [Ephemerocybe angulata]|uniref:Cytochrome P450 n=1 Tax=Ephemerocybe angulata TaxID=980116 RepID=A0A8H6I3R8_9AGAR|nr:cytochrome P450 [Tulosesus angulatus]